jgi:sugar phosphate isomerase/epimerase
VELGCSVSLQDIKIAELGGFDFLELPTEILVPELEEVQFKKVREALQKSSLPVKSFNVFLPSHLVIVGQNVNRKKYESYVLTSLRRMKELGGERVSFGSGSSRSCPPNFPKEKAREQIIDFLKFTGESAEKYGIQVNIESLNRSECNMINSLLEAMWYVKEIKLPNVSLIADFYHMQMERENLNNLLDVKNILNYVHIADRDRLYPGSGNFPFNELMATLRKINYQGPISVECIWQDSEKEIPLAAGYLKSIIGQGLFR